MGKLTSHVLDTTHGCPAAGMSIELYRTDADQHKKLGSFVTNADGRIDGTLLDGAAFKEGVYELVFDVGSYFSAQSGGDQRGFLGQVPVRFCVTDANSHYHVPLLVSPYGYSTYRGS